MKPYPIKRISKPTKCEGCGKYLEKGESGIYVNKCYGGMNYKIRLHNKRCLELFKNKNQKVYI